MTQNDTENMALENWLKSLVAKELKTEPDEIRVDAELTNLGLDSMSAVTVAGDIELELGIEIDSTVLWDHPTIQGLAVFLSKQGCKAPTEGAI